MFRLKLVRGSARREVQLDLIFRFLQVLVVLGCWWVLCSGCASDRKGASARFAFVALQGNTPGQICGMAMEVFKAHGYKVVQSDLAHMVFEKKATAMSNLTYGNWGDEPSLTVRVKADVLPDGDRAYLLQCQAYMVRDRGSSLEEEIKMGHHKNGPYQALLDEVANRLHATGSQPRS